MTEKEIRDKYREEQFDLITLFVLLIVFAGIIEAVYKIIF